MIMFTTDKRTKGVTLHALDIDGIAAAALDKWAQHQAVAGQDVDPRTTLKVGQTPYGAVEHNGHLYVICVEGVGWEVTDDEPLVLELYPETRDDDNQLVSFGLMPVMTAKLSPADVKARMTDETVDLADLIRTFGARLEGNFWTWHKVLTESQ